MKNYIIKYADGRWQNIMQAIHNSRKEATKTIMNYLGDNKDYDLSPFDFTLEEVDVKDVNEIITDFERAREALGLKPNTFYNLSKHVPKFISDINPKHIEALNALNELFTIAEAWNKEDGFVPDFSDWDQDKWFPWFKYDEDAAGFVFALTTNAPARAYAAFGSRLCFKSSARAAQFGKQFVDLYNKIFL